MIKELLPQEMRCATDCMDLLVECCTGALLCAAQHPDTQHAAAEGTARQGWLAGVTGSPPSNHMHRVCATPIERGQ